MILLDAAMAMKRTLFPNAADIVENPKFITHLMLTQITSFAKKFGASKNNPFVIALEGKNNWRKKFYLDNREGIPRLEDQTYKGNRVKNEMFDWNAIYEAYNAAMESLKNYSDMYVVQVDCAEGDDVIACLAKEFKSSHAFIWVVSSDKDFVQLQDANVKIFDQHKQIFKPEVDVPLYKKMHSILGDKGDNVLNIRKGIGEKTAIKILPDLDDMLATDPLLRKHFAFNQNLVDFDYIPQHVHDAVIEEYNKQEFSFNGMKLMGDFVKFNLVKHAEDINNFKLSDQIIETKLTSQHATIQKINDIEADNLDDFFS